MAPSSEQLGSLMQSFYLQLAEASSAPPGQEKALSPLIRAINHLEDALLYEGVATEQLLAGECVAEEVALEIVQDCQKKGSAAIRVHYAERVRTIISTCRKHLRTKTNIMSTGSASGGDHSQRHLNALVELLGSWSNIIAELLAHDVSDELLSLVVSPLHTRVSETAISCFQDFKDDKKLDQWHRKAALSNNSNGSDGSSSGAMQSVLSLAALDYVLCQVVAMRGVVHQYQYFLAETCGLPELADETSPTMHPWLELDACYMSLEGLYLQSATKEALQIDATQNALLERNNGNDVARMRNWAKFRLPWQHLLEVQENMFSLQSVEDYFFIMQKILDRALLTNTESAIFSICSQMVESMSPQTYFGGDEGVVLNKNYCNVFNILSHRKNFKDITKLKDEASADSENMEKQEDDVDVMAVSSAVGENLALTTLAIADSLTSGYAGSWFSSFSAPLTSALVSDSDQGVSSEISKNDTCDKSASKTEVKSIKSDKSLSEPDFADLQQAFITALEMDSVEIEENDTELILSIEDQAVMLNSLTTVTQSIQGLQETISSCVKLAEVEDINASCQIMPSLSIIVEEFDRCYTTYDNMLSSEVNILERNFLLQALDLNIRKLLMLHPKYQGDSVGSDSLSEKFDLTIYQLTGDEFDKVQHDFPPHFNPLAVCIRNIFGWHHDKFVASKDSKHGPDSTTSKVESNDDKEQSDVGSELGLWRKHVCREVLLRVLLCVATTINDGIMTLLLGTSAESAVFKPSVEASTNDSEKEGELVDGNYGEVDKGILLNEWGALLLCDYIMEAIDEMENIAVTECDTSIRPCFLQLIWAMKILTLDQPADLRRCQVPFKKANLISVTGETLDSSAALVKCILSRRLDFSREAIFRMKINVMQEKGC